MRFGVTTKRFLLYAEYAWQVHTRAFFEKRFLRTTKS